MVNGHVQLKDQMRDYINRGNALEEWSYLDFFLGTYDGKIREQNTSARGRTANTRVPYLENCGRDGHARIIRSAGHETMPYFPGSWFAKRDPENVNGLFEASMLALLKPWRRLTDLKDADVTFRQAFDDFLSTVPEHIHRSITNIEFFHECSEAATIHQHSVQTHSDPVTEISEETVAPDDEQIPSDENTMPINPFTRLITEEEIQEVTDNPYSAQEQLYAEVALGVGTDSGALIESPATSELLQRSLPASDSQRLQFHIWEKQMDAIHVLNGDDSHSSHDNTACVQPLPFTSETIEEPSVVSLEAPVTTTDATHPSLNDQQSMVHNIITNHLRVHLKGEHPEQLLLIVHGQGGTGKSELLNAISRTFDSLQAKPLLAKTAMSGVAASIIGGETLHSWAALPVTTPTSDKWLTHPNKRIMAKRQQNMGDVLWLMIDEISMLTTSLLHRLSQVTGFMRGDKIKSTIPFGGINVLLLGDFHQFPPVANTSKELYHPTPTTDDCRLGRELFLQFKTVVHLEKQMRIRDATWINILQRSRTGECTSEDIEEIRKLILTNPKCIVPDFSRPPWDNAILVTPRNSVRTKWNEKMLHAYCRKNNNTRYIVYANDSTGKNALTCEDRLAIAHLKLDKTGRLPNKLELARGMKAMVLENIAPNAGLANGSRGEIVDIILDPNEIVSEHSCESIKLQYPPAAVLFAPYIDRGTQLQGLPKGVVPIFPTQKKFKLGGRSGTTVTRTQLALTPAYAFTDFKSQGQTIENVIIDLANTPSGGLTGFNAYVALSRSRGRDTIRLLRDFDSTLFTKHPNELLRMEDERLQILARETIDKYTAGDFGPFRTLSV